LFFVICYPDVQVVQCLRRDKWPLRLYSHWFNCKRCRTSSLLYLTTYHTIKTDQLSHKILFTVLVSRSVAILFRLTFRIISLNHFDLKSSLKFASLWSLSMLIKIWRSHDVVLFSFAAPKCSSIFQQKFLLEISSLKIEYFLYFATFSKFRQKWSFQNFDYKKNIGEHGICNFSTNFLGGGKLLRQDT